MENNDPWENLPLMTKLLILLLPLICALDCIY